MRRSLATFPPLSATRTASFLSSFSTSSGRGRGLPVDFSLLGGAPPGQPVDQSQPPPPPPPQNTYSPGRGGGAPTTPPPLSQEAFTPRSGVDSRIPPSSGHGRGGVSPPPPYSGQGRGRVSSSQATDSRIPASSGRGTGGVSPGPPYAGRGRGGIAPPQSQGPAFTPRNDLEGGSAQSNSRKPMMFIKEEEDEEAMKRASEPKLPTGRGTPIRPKFSVSVAVGVDDAKPEQENRHIRKVVRGKGVRGEARKGEAVKADPPPKGPKLSRADAVAKAKGILSKGDDGGVDRVGGRGGGRGRGKARGGRGRRRGGRAEDDEGDYVDYEVNEVQDKANEEMLAKRLGPEMMNTMVEAFEDIADRALPSPADDAYINALHTNLMVLL